MLPSVIGGPDGCLGIPVLNEARSEEKSVDEPNDNDGDQNEAEGGIAGADLPDGIDSTQLGIEVPPIDVVRVNHSMTFLPQAWCER